MCSNYQSVPRAGRLLTFSFGERNAHGHGHGQARRSMLRAKGSPAPAHKKTRGPRGAPLRCLHVSQGLPRFVVPPPPEAVELSE